MSNTLWFALGAVVGGLLTVLGRNVYSSLQGRCRRASEDTEQSRHLTSVRKKLRDFAFRADQMYEAVLAERVEVESRSDKQQRTQSSQFNVPDVRAWHAEVQSFIGSELGPSAANDFGEDYRHWEQYDLSDLNLVMRLLGKKKNSVLGLAREIAESDLVPAKEQIALGRLRDPRWQCFAATILPALLALLMVAVFESLA